MGALDEWVPTERGMRPAGLYVHRSRKIDKVRRVGAPLLVGCILDRWMVHFAARPH
jgi:hypothetical protein